MRWFWVLLLLLAPGTTFAAQTRAPEVQVLLNTGSNSAATKHAYMIWGKLMPMLAAYGVKYSVYTSSHNRPLWVYRGGHTERLTSAQNQLYWGRDRGFDGLIIINWDFNLGVGGDARFDSLSRVARYPMIPLLLVNSVFGFNPNSTICSLGTANANITTNTSYFRFNGGYLSEGGGTTNIGALWSQADKDSAVSALVATKTSAMTNTKNTDTLFVWHRAVGAGITVCNTQVAANENTALNSQNYAIAIAKFISGLPDSLRPRPTFKWALHIDDGWKRRTSGGARAPSDFATVKAGIDSLVARGIKYTVGVECSAESLDAQDPDGESVHSNDMRLFKRDGYFKWTPHTHAGVGSADTPAALNLPSAAALRFVDLLGTDRNRNCDPTSTQDTSLVMLNTAAVTYLKQRIGAQYFDPIVMPSTDDSSPKNTYNPPFDCSFDGQLSAYRRAGFTHVREAWGTMDQSRYLASNDNDIGGTGQGSRVVYTAYGPLTMVGRGNGYFPDSNQDVFQAGSFTGLAVAQIISQGFGGFIGYDNVSTNSMVGVDRNNMIVQHVRNYCNQQPGLIFIRDIDNYFRAFNEIAGYRAHQWVWSGELGTSHLEIADQDPVR